MKIILRAVAALIIWLVVYAVLDYPISFFIGMIFGFSLRVNEGLLIYQHPDSPYQIVMGALAILSDAVLSTWLTIRICRWLWQDKKSN